MSQQDNIYTPCTYSILLYLICVYFLKDWFISVMEYSPKWKEVEKKPKTGGNQIAQRFTMWFQIYYEID